MAKKNKTGAPHPRLHCHFIRAAAKKPPPARAKASPTSPVGQLRAENEIQEDDWITRQLPTFD